MSELPPTCKSVTASLFWGLTSASQILIPRYTPRDWWECDMWRLTHSDFVDEYEIKMSVADFRADFAKAKDPRSLWNRELRVWDEIKGREKHQLLATEESGPNRFWFVIPHEMEGKVEIPPYAGLMVFNGRCRPRVVKQAPKRHGRKWTGDKLAIFKTFYHRFWNHEVGRIEDAESSFEPISNMDEEQSAEKPQLTLI